MTTTPDAVTPRLAHSGTWHLTLKAAFHRDGRDHDLVLEWRRRDGIWDRECIGLTPTLISSLHEFRIALDQTPDTVKAEGRIDPDPWAVIGGPMRVTLHLPGEGRTGPGRYEGTFADTPIQGVVEARYEPAPRASLGASAPPPTILEAFERDGCASPLYDYAWAGRDTADPTPGLPVFDATDHGLRPDSGQEALPAIQAAIDAASAAGGGVVQLPPGILDCNVDRKLPPLRIRADRVVLRGSGSGPDGTLLVNHRYSDTPNPAQPWRAGEHPLLVIGGDLQQEEPEPRVITAVTEGKRGRRAITVDDTAQLTVGQTCLLRQLEVEDGSLARSLVMDQVEVASNYRGAGKALVTQIVRVTAIDGRAVEVDAPLHRDIAKWPAQLCDYPMTHQSGVMHLRMRGLWAGFFVHHKNGEHDNGWDQVKFVRVRAGWAEDLVHENTTCAIGLSNCLGCVAQRCRIMGNHGHNGFVINRYSTGNLMRDCHAGRNMHGFNCAGTICGNAVVDCTMDEPSGVDLHGGLSLDNLFDNLVGGINKGGGAGHAVPPRHGPGYTLWNWSAGHYDPYKPWQRAWRIADHTTTPGYICVGVHGQYGQQIIFGAPDGDTTDPLQTPCAWIESPNQRVTPRSLYDWQRARWR